MRDHVQGALNDIETPAAILSQLVISSKNEINDEGRFLLSFSFKSVYFVPFKCFFPTGRVSVELSISKRNKYTRRIQEVKPVSTTRKKFTSVKILLTVISLNKPPSLFIITALTSGHLS